MKPLIFNVAADGNVHGRESAARRAYLSPSLTHFGLVQDLTQAGTGLPNENQGPEACLPTFKKPNVNCPASDSRLKTNIRPMSTSSSGMQFYLFEYKPEYKSECGLGTYFGFMAQEVLQKYPSAVVTRPDGYFAIDYCRLRQLLH